MLTPLLRPLSRSVNEYTAEPVTHGDGKPTVTFPIAEDCHCPWPVLVSSNVVLDDHHAHVYPQVELDGCVCGMPTMQYSARSAVLGLSVRLSKWACPKMTSGQSNLT